MIEVKCFRCGRVAKESPRSIRSFQFNGNWSCRNQIACVKRQGWTPAAVQPPEPPTFSWAEVAPDYRSQP